MESESGSLLHRDNRVNGKKKSLSGKTENLDNFTQNRRLLFAQVVNFMILKVKDIAIFPVG